MGAFDSPNDTLNQIKHEGDTIVLTFSPGDPQTGQGTVRWNIPAPMLGCASDSPGAYCGMVVLLSTQPFTINNAPQDGVLYEADPQADPDIHVGDRINGALVIGAFYEGEKKSRGEELTTSFVIQGLQPRTNYYVIGYAVDCQGRYHRDGQRAYSDNLGTVTDPGTPAYQTVVLKDGNGALPTDGTGLVSGTTYEFEFLVNTNFPNTNTSRTIKVSEDGINLGTYQDLADAINKAIAQADNPPHSPVPPDQGRYYWDGTRLFQWDGTNNQLVDTLVEPTDPSVVASGSYWYNPSTEQLSTASGSPLAWTSVDVIRYVEDPTNLTMGDDYWFDGTTAYRYCTETWCEEVVHVQNFDPLTKPVPDCSVYWYDESNSILNHWNHDFDQWETAYAVQWNTPPNALADGTYWYNYNTEELFLYSGSPLAFASIPFIRLNEDPTTQSVPVSDGTLWYNWETEELKVWNSVGSPTGWVDVPVLVWPEDPRNIESCDLWWNTVTDRLLKWDSVHLEWDEVGEFTQAATDPYAQPVLDYGELWYNPDTSEMKRWDGVRWLDVTHVEHPTDPTQPAFGTAWNNTADGTWFVWSGSPAAWAAFDPFDSITDPTLIPSGTLWYDTTSNALYQRVGTSWIAIPFSTQPYYPSHGDVWFDTTNDVLMEWVRNPDRDPTDPLSNQGEWIPATPIAEAIIDSNGNLTIHTTGTGSDKLIAILIPEGTNYATYEGLASGDAGLDTICCFDDYDKLPATTVSAGSFLFSHLVPPGGITHFAIGDDGVHELPTYEQLGVGTDGSPDERREMIDWVRSQLGYPVVEVELTNKQIDEAIDFALETIRQRTSIAYQRSAFFLDIKPGYQHYKLTDRTCGFHKVVTVMAAYRFTSAFLSSAHGSGVYGQIVLQHLYNMGTFDLLSYHLVSEYVEQLEHLFATRLVYHWNESERVLSFYQSFTVPERILLDVTVERTEQSILKDRWIRTWIKRYTLMKSMETLAQIRGKYASLPGAGGGVSLNAADLMTKASELKEELDQEIEDYVTNDPEDIGMHSTFIMG